MRFWVFTIVSLLLSVLGSAEQCGTQANGALCPGGLCCSKFGWCGNTNAYCGDGCQSQCGGGGGDGIEGIISRDTFNELLLHRNDAACESNGFYTYDAFLAAAEAYPAFGNTGDDATRRREIAAFLAQTSHETTGGWPTAPDGPYSWGYCFIREINRQNNYCDPNYPCPRGPFEYYGRGPIQLTWNYNYLQAGQALGVDLINNPDLVATDPVISFEAAIWFWMTPQSPKPSSHDVITGSWTPSTADNGAGRVPGYGVITNIINGGIECGLGPNPQVESRIGFFKRYCEVLGTDTGDNLDCYSQRPFGTGLLLDTI